MYLSEVHAGKRVRRRRFYSPFLGESPSDPQPALMPDAITRNRAAWLERKNLLGLIQRQVAAEAARLGRPLQQRELLEVIARVVASTSGTPSPAALGAAALAAAASPLERAVQANRRYAQALGWLPHLQAIAALIGFQSQTPTEEALVEALARWQASRGLQPDGILGPATWNQLRAALGAPAPARPPAAQAAAPVAAAAAARTADTPLPTPGPGYYSYAGSARQYGRAAMIAALQAVGAAWARAHPNGPRLGFGDLSFQGGGPMPPHKSHQAGLDVDIRPVRGDGREAPVTYQDPAYSQALTQELVHLLHQNGVLPVQFILFNDPQVNAVRAWAGHDNHLHVRFQP